MSETSRQVFVYPKGNHSGAVFLLILLLGIPLLHLATTFDPSWFAARVIMFPIVWLVRANLLRARPIAITEERISS